MIQPMPARPAGAILAGGRASRLQGVEKGLLDVGGVRIIDRVADALMPVVSEMLVITSAAGAAAWLPNARVIPDALTGGGSAAGVHAALRAAIGPVIVVAWDMPFVLPQVCAALAEAGSLGGADVVAPRGDRSGALEPLCAWYAPACARAIEETWEAGDRSLHGLFGRVRTSVLEPGYFADLGPVDRLFLNVNTADDLALARRMALRRPNAGALAGDGGATPPA